MKLASVLWRLCFAALLATLAWQAYQLRNLSAWMQTQIEREGNETRAAALEAIASVGSLLDRRISIIQDQVFHEVAEIRQEVSQDADRQLSGIRGDLDRQLLALNASVAEAMKLREDIRPVLAEAQETLAQTSSTIAVVRPQALGLIAASKVTAGATAQTMRVVAKEAPETGQAVREIAQSAAGIAADGRKVADDLTKPKGFWGNVKSWCWALAGIAGRIL